ncbi:MAG: pentapeptide repeat-containing protein, partial [Gemmatimonadaceae bacterium]|nr:pentapeptide repeat-containing protein [Gemmatimonadaceae bacterium]
LRRAVLRRAVLRRAVLRRAVLRRAVLHRAVLRRAVLHRAVLRQSRCSTASAVPNHATLPRTGASRHELTVEGYTAVPQQDRFASYVLRQSRRSTAVAVPDHATFSPHRRLRTRTDRRGFRYGCSASYRSASKPLQYSCCNSGPRKLSSTPTRADLN